MANPKVECIFKALHKHEYENIALLEDTGIAKHLKRTHHQKG